MHRYDTTRGLTSVDATAPRPMIVRPAIVRLACFTARRALFAGAALAVMALPVGIGGHDGWLTAKSAFADHDSSGDNGVGHDGNGGGNGGGGNSGGAGGGGDDGGGNSGGAGGGDGGGGSSGGSGTPGSGSGGDGGGGSSGGNTGSAGGGGGQNAGDGADRDQQEAAIESFVENSPESPDAAGDTDASEVAGAPAANGGLGVPAITAVIGAAGVTTLSAEEELALIATGWQ